MIGAGSCRPCQCASLLTCMLLLLVGCTQLVGCTHKDLVYPNQGLRKVDIRFLWDNAQHASPEGMTLLFYPLDEGEFWRFEISGKNGGIVEIPEGAYTMIAVNNDLSGITITDMPYELASINVKEMPRSQTYAGPTGMVYLGKVDNLKLTSKGVSYLNSEGSNVLTGMSVVDCYPDSTSTVCNVIAADIAGMEHVESASAIIEGFAPGLSLSSMKPLTSSVSVPFDLETDVEGASFTGSTTGFLSDHSSASYQLTFHVVYHNGGAYEKTYDVTDQVVNYFYQHNVYIIIRGMALPEEPTIKPDEVGIKVDVDGWRVVDVNIDSTDY